MNCKNFLFICLFINLYLHMAYAQNAYIYGGGAGQVSLATISEQLKGTDAIYFNTASVASSKNDFGLDVSFENKYNISAINTFSLGLFKKIQGNTFVLSAIQHGNDVLNEKDIALGISRKLFDKFYLGTKFHLNRLSIQEYGSSNSFSADVSLNSTINNTLSLSTSINNIGSTKLSKIFEKPLRMAIGLAYHPSDKINFIVEAEKIEDRPISPKLGIIYDFSKNLQLRTGVDAGRSIFGFGFIYCLKNFSINLGYSIHNELGPSPGISLQWEK